MKTLLLSIVTAALASAMTITPEAPGVQHSTVPGVVVESFDSLTPGLHLQYVSPVGTYTDLFAVLPYVFGGSDQTPYAAVGAQSGYYEYSLALAAPQSYFGMYWSAGDAANLLQFYSGNALVASFTAAQAFAGLGPAYYGNPNNGADWPEPFAYLNFYGGTFDRIVFQSTSLCCGFESDNHAIAGETVPEPGTLLLVGMALLMASRRRAAGGCR